MSGAVSVESSWAECLDHVSQNDLVDLVNDVTFVQSFHAKDTDDQDDTMLSVVEVLTDRFHDYFNLSSRQRKDVATFLMNKRKTVREVFATTETIYPVEPGPYLPAEVPGGAKGLTGSYPVAEPGRGRSPSVQSMAGPIEPRASSMPPG